MDKNGHIIQLDDVLTSIDTQGDSSEAGWLESTSIKQIVPTDNIYLVDSAGFIGRDLTQHFIVSPTVRVTQSGFGEQPLSFNYAIVSKADDFSDKGMGKVTFYPQYGNVIGGRAYKTVFLGGIEWMAENLDYAWPGLAVGDDEISETEPQAWYYNNDESTYGKYGLMYNQSAVEYIENNKASLCPGWHVPTNKELEYLMIAAGGYKDAYKHLRSKTDWNDTGDNDIKSDDKYGFGLLPGGIRDENNTFSSINQNAFLYSSSPYSYEPEYLTTLIVTKSSSALSVITYNAAFNVRLVKDYQ